MLDGTVAAVSGAQLDFSAWVAFLAAGADQQAGLEGDWNTRRLLPARKALHLLPFANEGCWPVPEQDLAGRGEGVRPRWADRAPPGLWSGCESGEGYQQH